MRYKAALSTSRITARPRPQPVGTRSRSVSRGIFADGRPSRGMLVPSRRPRPRRAAFADVRFYRRLRRELPVSETSAERVPAAAPDTWTTNARTPLAPAPCERGIGECRKRLPSPLDFP